MNKCWYLTPGLTPDPWVDPEGGGMERVEADVGSTGGGDGAGVISEGGRRRSMLPLGRR